MRSSRMLLCGTALALAGCARPGEAPMYEVDRYLLVPSASAGASSPGGASIARVPAPRRAPQHDVPAGATEE